MHFDAKCAALKFGALTRRRETTNPLIGAIEVEGSRCAGRVGERYIGVRSEQICGVPGQARRVVFALPGTTIIPAGTLDDTSWLKPTMEIYCDDAQSWVQLGGGGMQRFPKMHHARG